MTVPARDGLHALAPHRAIAKHIQTVYGMRSSKAAAEAMIVQAIITVKILAKAPTALGHRHAQGFRIPAIHTLILHYARSQAVHGTSSAKAPLNAAP